MKPFSYYKETSVSMPRQDDYTTIYYYRKGVVIGIKKQFDDDFVPPKNCVEEKVLDEVSYNAHLKHYQEEHLRLQEEFRRDLIDEYDMSYHPKANDCFDRAWDYGNSDLFDVADIFGTIVELVKDDYQPQLTFI